MGRARRGREVAPHRAFHTVLGGRSRLCSCRLQHELGAAAGVCASGEEHLLQAAQQPDVPQVRQAARLAVSRAAVLQVTVLNCPAATGQESAGQQVSSMCRCCNDLSSPHCPPLHLQLGVCRDASGDAAAPVHSGSDTVLVCHVLGKA